jgi:hypothetical protein
LHSLGANFSAVASGFQAKSLTGVGGSALQDGSRTPRSRPRRHRGLADPAHLALADPSAETLDELVDAPRRDATGVQKRGKSVRLCFRFVGCTFRCVFAQLGSRLQCSRAKFTYHYFTWRDLRCVDSSSPPCRSWSRRSNSSEQLRHRGISEPSSETPRGVHHGISLKVYYGNSPGLGCALTKLALSDGLPR